MDAGRGRLLAGRGTALAGRGWGAAVADGRRRLRAGWNCRLIRGMGCTSPSSLVSWRCCRPIRCCCCWAVAARGAAACGWKAAKGSAGSAHSQLAVPGAAWASRLAMKRLACSLSLSWRLAAWACACRWGCGEGGRGEVVQGGWRSVGRMPTWRARRPAPQRWPPSLAGLPSKMEHAALMQASSTGHAAWQSSWLKHSPRARASPRRRQTCGRRATAGPRWPRCAALCDRCTA